MTQIFFFQKVSDCQIYESSEQNVGCQNSGAGDANGQNLHSHGTGQFCHVNCGASPRFGLKFEKTWQDLLLGMVKSLQF